MAQGSRRCPAASVLFPRLLVSSKDPNLKPANDQIVPDRIVHFNETQVICLGDVHPNCEATGLLICFTIVMAAKESSGKGLKMTSSRLSRGSGIRGIRALSKHKINQSYSHKRLQHCCFRIDHLPSLPASIFQFAPFKQSLYALKRRFR